MAGIKRAREEETTTRNTRARGNGVNDNNLPTRNGTPVIDLDEHELVDEDEDDIPYTHRRSASPVLLSLELDNLAEEVDREVSRGPNKDGAQMHEVIELDDEDDDVLEYYVVTDDDSEEVVKNMSDDEFYVATKEKSTNEQLEENKRQNNSLLSTLHCAVCFDSPEKTFVLRCGHAYCGDCIYKALSSTRQSTPHGGPCSLCRSYSTYKGALVAIFKEKRKTLKDMPI